MHRGTQHRASPADTIYATGLNKFDETEYPGDGNNDPAHLESVGPGKVHWIVAFDKTTNRYPCPAQNHDEMSQDSS